MNRSSRLFVVLVASLGASVVGAEPRRPAPITGKPDMRVVQQPQISGRITWNGDAKPGAGDTCGHFLVNALETVGATGEGRALGVSGKATGTILKGSCTYMLGGVPAGKEVFVTADYRGPMTASGIARKSGRSATFSVQDNQHYSQDVSVRFEALK